MNSLEKALAWAALGQKVIPVFEVDTWVGDRLHEMKTPDTRNGLLDGSTNIEAITKYWTANPNRLVGVVAGRLDVLDIDIDVENGVDGFNSLADAGIELPETFIGTTRRGGAHMVYRGDESRSLGPQADLKLPNGSVLKGVDRRSGKSYFIAWYDKVPTSIKDLAPTPDWMTVQAPSIANNSYSGSVESWLQSIPQGAMDSRVINAVSKFPDEDFGHDVMIRKQTNLVMLAQTGAVGVSDALELLRSLWLFGKFDTLEYRDDWNASLAGAVAKFGALVSNAGVQDKLDPLESRITSELDNLRVKHEATRRLDGLNYVGSNEITLSDLKSHSVDFIVQDLVPEASICFLLARPNLGKTFAYVDMVCRIIFGMDWLGKETKKVKVLIVLGEGLTGFYDRLLAWMEFHNQDISRLDEYLFFIDGANLNNDVSIAKVREVADREGIGLIIFDTWANTSGATNEDDAALNSTTMNRAMKIRPEATLFFVHHPNKASEKTTAPEMRGSGALKGRADVVMTMYDDKDFVASNGEKQQWIALSTEGDHRGKNRHARNETIKGLYLCETSIGAVFDYSNTASISKESVIVRTNLTGAMTAEQLASKIGKSKATATRYLNIACKQGVAAKIESGARNTPDTFKLTDYGTSSSQPNYSQIIEALEQAEEED
jgi:hypothetical protein